MPTRQPRQEDGFSLIETTVALAVLFLVILGVSGLMGLAYTNQVRTHEHESASLAAARQLELVTATPYDNVDTIWDDFAFHATTDTGNLPPADAAFLPLNVDDIDTAEDEAAMAGHVAITVDPENTGDTNLLEVRVVVAYKASDGENQRVELVSRMVDPTDDGE